MTSFEDIEQIIRESRAQAGQQVDQRILSSAQQTFVRSTVGPWRRALRTGLPLKVAALIIIGVGLMALLLPNQSGLRLESVAVADIQQAIEAQGTIHVMGTRTCIFPKTDVYPEEVYECLTEKWVSDQGYIDVTTDKHGDSLLQVWYHFETGTVTVTYHFLKQFYRFQVPEFYREKVRELTPLGLIDVLFRSGEFTRLEPDTVNGIRAAGFEITDIDKRLDQSVSPAWMRFFFFNVKESSTRLWVDPDTKLPVHLHGDFLLDKCLLSDFEVMRLVEINDQWEWGAPVEQTFFPEQPEGYEAMVVPGMR